MSPARSTSRRVAGVLLIAVGLIANRWVLEHTVISDGEMESRSLRTLLGVSQVVFVLLGIMVFRGWRPPRPRAAGATALVVVGTMGVSVAVAEFVLRLPAGLQLAWPPPRIAPGELASRPSRNFAPDSILGWVMRTNHEFRWTIDDAVSVYRSDAAGFRNPSARVASADSSPTIFFAGDSFTFGTGVNVERTFGQVVDETVVEYPVYNLAMPGFGIDQMWLSVRHLALARRPMAVVVGFIDQDFDRGLTAYRVAEGFEKPMFVLEHDTLRPATPADRRSAVRGWLEHHSALWNTGRLAVRSLGYRADVGAWWKVNAAVFREMAEDAARRNVPLLFVRLPLREIRPFPQLATYMDALGADYLDLASSADRPADIHFETDDHINAAGHDYVARRILEWLEPVIRGH